MTKFLTYLNKDYNISLDAALFFGCRYPRTYAILSVISGVFNDLAGWVLMKPSKKLIK
jgi:hypothetical protein